MCAIHSERAVTAVDLCGDQEAQEADAQNKKKHKKMLNAAHWQRRAAGT